VLEERYADSQLDRLPNIVAELVGLKVRLILSAGNQVTRAVMEGTSTIPIVATTPDLLESGFVASLARPGGNVTGMSLTAGSTLGEKMGRDSEGDVPERGERRSASKHHLCQHRLYGSNPKSSVVARSSAAAIHGPRPRGGRRALQAIAGLKPDGLIIESDAVLVSSRSRIIAFATERRLPAIYGNLDYIPDCALMAYYTNIFEAWRRLATYVDRILKGAKPADLPVEQPTTFELVINLKTAKTLGLTIPPAILSRADEVIE
jgi:putative tryptophan/tyrosine transport system substrate-binding protein